MQKYLLGISAVNLYAVFSQSDNISMFRGASLTLREAAKLPDAVFSDASVTSEPVSIGASEGVYLITGEETNLSALLVNVKEHLAANYLGYTFVTDTVPLNGDYNTAKTHLKNRLGRLQQKQTRVSLQFSDTSTVCELTHILPGETTEPVQGEKRTVSTIAATRFKKGRDEKQSFYENELKTLGIPFERKLTFTNDLIALSENKEYRRLDGKLAYIYLDGNKFRAIQKESVDSVKTQQDFDNAMQTLRGQLLDELLSWCANDPDWQTPKGEIRLETLLWGGDEILFVVPAWKALDTTAKIFDITRNWQFNGYPLTHAVGVLFCKNSMPVFRMRQVAQKLADEQKVHAKSRFKGQADDTNKTVAIAGTINVFDMLVLESEDFAEDSIEAHANHRYGKLAEVRNQAMPGAFSEQQLADIRAKLVLMSRSQIYLLANTATICTNFGESDSRFVQQEERFVLVQDGVSKEAYDDLTKLLGLLLLGLDADKLYPITTDKEALAFSEQRRGLTWLLVTECSEYLLPEKEERA